MSALTRGTGPDPAVLREARISLDELEGDASRTIGDNIEALSRLRDSLGSVIGDLDALLEASRARALPADVAGHEVISAAQARVLQLLPSGATRREIARTLFLSENTVKTHLRGIYRALDVTDRGAAIAVARRRDLL